MAHLRRKLIILSESVFFIVTYTFSVWGTSLLHWWDKCVSRMDKPKTREFKRQTNQWCFVCFSFGALNKKKLLKFIKAENQDSVRVPIWMYKFFAICFFPSPSNKIH